ncbi:MAG TPA: hypothetical protein VGP93_07010, partial [Polyangiaceae bacterium]|nr:hypothetical protein [Polyangiaceae bacterium]
SWTAYSQCKRTKGFDCAILTRDDANCIRITGAPNRVTCKVDSVPPSGCISLDATDYCCT